MQAEKLIVVTDANGQLTQPLVLTPNARFEAIFLTLPDKKIKSKRMPSAKIFGKGEILGDIMKPINNETDWSVLT